MLSDFTLEELEYAIRRLNPKKSPGPDVISGQMIVHFGEIAKKYLLNIFITSWRSANGADYPQSPYKIPHGHNFLHFYQTTYRANHSTVDQLFYLSQTIINGFQEKPHEKTVAVFLDLSSAFDRVWRQKLVDIIHSSGIKGNALLWINDLLRGRKFSVEFNGVRSKSHRLWAGVPQGSVLSPLLFLLYMDTIHPHIHPDTKIACYADDIALWHTHRHCSLRKRFKQNAERHCSLGKRSLIDH
ncbi:reverse transcriptase domain-containing protein [Trichonephila clavipes]|uniref:Reverse transcriptase domain-containing protein n=1 Tax=Trichonephila clavipes TaxID=2585209 RepID=A0A8X7BB01_TRICX|nr:reverse transcriptase domain-containing protein [Trichonephila clavipes]